MNLTETHILVKALSATQSPVTITDNKKKDNPIVYCNDAFIKLTGYTRKEIIGSNCRFLQGDDTDAVQVKNLRDAIDSEKDVSVIIRNYTKQGKGFWNNLQVSPVYDNNGVVSHFIGLQTDVTERIEQEKERARTKKLETEKKLLSLERERLLKLNEAKDDFIAVASHQLRTPATNVKQYLGMLVEPMLGDFQPKQLNAIKIAYRNNDHQLKIIDDLLRIARLDTGKVVLNKTRVDVAMLLESLAQSFEYRLVNANQKLDLIIPKRGIFLDLDHDLILTALENLIDNAIKYSNESSTIKISLSEQNGQVSIIVKDEGVGMSALDLKKIFQKFVRANTVSSKNIGGTGLGLYWVKTVLDMHDAKINVTSKLKTGTTFTVIFSDTKN